MRQYEKYYYPLLLALSFVSFFPIITAPELIDRDINLVIGPLTKVHSFADYFDIFVTKELLDIQPVRDVFLLIDIYLSRLMGYQFFGFSNWLLWIGCCLVAQRIALKYTTHSLANTYLLLLACHPLMAWVISWPLAKKHLLASLFCLLASLKAVEYKIENRPTGFSLFLFYFLGLLSHPIILLWPVVLFFYLWESLSRNETKKILAIIFLTTVSIGFIHWFYYTSVLAIYTGASVPQPPLLEGLARKLFAFSRGFTQILAPFHFASNYYIANPLGFIELPLTLFLFVTKMREKTRIAFFLLLISHPLITTNMRATSVFLSDTYLVLSLVGFYFFFALQRSNRLFISYLILAFFIPKSFYESQIASREQSYLKMSYQREPECKNIISLTEYYLRKMQLEDFIHYSGIALNNKCLIQSLQPQLMINDLYAYRVYLDTDSSAQDKLDVLTKAKIISPDIVFLQISLLYQTNQNERADHLSKELPKEALRYRDMINKIRDRDCPQCPKI